MQAAAHAVAADARLARIDHVANPRHRQRGLCDIGREHHPHSRATALEYAILLGLTQARIQWQHAQPVVISEHLGELANVSLTGQEHQRIAAGAKSALLNLNKQVGDLLAHALVPILGITHILDIYRVGPAADFDHRCVIKMLGEARHIDGRRGHDDFEIRTSRK